MSLTRRLILQKARHHPTQARALTDCRHTVSGTISLPSRGTFHHSLTVLSAIGHWEVFRLTGWSRQIHSRFHGPAATRERITKAEVFSSTGLSPSTTGHPRPLRLTQRFLTPAQAGGPEKKRPTTPHTQPPPGITCTRFSHPPLSLATTHGITFVFSSYGY